jgi:hypothetical protein
MADLQEQLDTVEQRLADDAVRLLQEWQLLEVQRKRGDPTDHSEELLSHLTDSLHKLSIRRDELRAALASEP